MKNLAISCYLRFAWTELASALSAGGAQGLATTTAPSLIFCKPSTTTFSPGSNPEVMTQLGPVAWPGFHGTNLYFASRADDAELIGALHFADCALRNHDRILQNLRDHAGAGVETRTQYATRIFHPRSDEDRAGGSLRLSICCEQPGSVGKG